MRINRFIPNCSDRPVCRALALGWDPSFWGYSAVCRNQESGLWGEDSFEQVILRCSGEIQNRSKVWRGGRVILLFLSGIIVKLFHELDLPIM